MDCLVVAQMENPAYLSIIVMNMKIKQVKRLRISSKLFNIYFKPKFRLEMYFFMSFLCVFISFTHSCPETISSRTVLKYNKASKRKDMRYTQRKLSSSNRFVSREHLGTNCSPGQEFVLDFLFL